MTGPHRLPYGGLGVPFALVCSLANMSCAPEANELAWSVTFDEQLALEGAIVTAWVAAGGCASTDRGHEVELARGATAEDSLALAPGRYGFAAEALSPRCEQVAYGCTERSLPGDADEPVQVVLQRSAGAARCSPQSCVAGRCVGASVDAGEPRTERTDAQLPARDGGGLGIDDAALPEAGSGGTDAQAPSTPNDAGDAASVGACPDGVRGPNGHCYRDKAQSLDFLTGRSLCAQAGGYLVVLDDANEEAWVAQAFARSQDFWLGLTDVRDETVWLREDDRAAAQRVPASYFHWDASNPDGGRTSNCARYRVASAAWRDGSCFDTQRVICESP